MPSRKRPLSATHNLAAACPEAARMWHPTLNADTPRDVTPGSNKQRWWRCLADPSHEAWPQKVQVLAKGHGCPTCAGKRLDPRKSLAAVAPHLVAEWDADSNTGLSPETVSYGSKKMVNWRCEAWNHTWPAPPNNRTSNGSGCPHCRPGTSRIELAITAELMALFPGEVEWRAKEDGRECDVLLRGRSVAIEVDGFFWHLGREDRDREKGAALAERGIRLLRVRDRRLGRLEEDDVLYDQTAPTLVFMADVASALADMMPEEDTRLARYVAADRLIGTAWYDAAVGALPGPPPGRSLAYLHPEVAADWDNAANGPIRPHMLPPKSHFPANWRCAACDHRWPATVNSRTNGGNGCPACAGRVATPEHNLAVIFPEVGAEWDWEANGSLKPTEVTPFSNRKVGWRCSAEPGHRWSATIQNRTSSGSGCPRCLFTSLVEHSPEVAAEWHPTRNGEATPETVSYGSRIPKRWWLCRACKHQWEATVNSRTFAPAGRGCPVCSGKVATPGRCLADLHPGVAADLVPGQIDESTGATITAADLLPNSNKNLLWRCPRGHERRSVVQARVKSGRCPECKGTRRSPEASGDELPGLFAG